MSLALWEFFWNTSDWSGTAIAATSVTFTGPSTGLINQPSLGFTVGANGAISGTLVVTVAATGGAGVLSKSVFSLSAGATTGTFTFTPAALGLYTLTNTNNQALTNASSLPYNAVANLIFGAQRHASQYEALPDDYWQNRERHLREDFRIRHGEPFTHLSVLEPNNEVHNAIAELQSERSILADALVQASDVQQLSAMAQRIKGIDAEIADLAPSRYTLVKKNIT